MPNTAATAAPTTSIGKNGRSWFANGELLYAYVYAPIAKNAAYPRSSRPASPMTTLRPIASRTYTPALAKASYQGFADCSRLSGGIRGSRTRSRPAKAMEIRIVAERWTSANARIRARAARQPVWAGGRGIDCMAGFAAVMPGHPAAGRG